MVKISKIKKIFSKVPTNCLLFSKLRVALHRDVTLYTVLSHTKWQLFHLQNRNKLLTVKLVPSLNTSHATEQAFSNPGSALTDLNVQRTPFHRSPTCRTSFKFTVESRQGRKSNLAFNTWEDFLRYVVLNTTMSSSYTLHKAELVAEWLCVLSDCCWQLP